MQITGGIIINILKAEHRDQSVKAKKLRRENMIPASIYGKSLNESVLIQIPLADVNRFLSTSSRGSTLTIEVGGEQYNVLFKKIAYAPVSGQVEHIEFQHLVANEAVNSVAKIVLTNREKNQNLIQQLVGEIPYNALPKHFVPEILIDLDGMEVGTSVQVKDLDIAKNEHIKLAMAEDIVVLSIASLKKAAVEEETVDEEKES